MKDPVIFLDGFMATSATAGGGFSGGIMSFAPFILVLGVMYFMMIRPQQKKEKQRQEMVAALKRGDRILTTGGLIGTIHKVLGGGELSVEIAEGTRIRVLGGAVTQVLDKTALSSAAPEDVFEPSPASESTAMTKDGGAKKAAPKKTVRKAAPRKTTASPRQKKTAAEQKTAKD